ncbi:MAG: ABC transporter permease subunit [Actinomycetota bacterium]|nr:ABC transporter permease subunit [Actinomycetota bacterium]
MNATVVMLAVRAVFGRRRGVLLFVLPGVLFALAVLVRVIAGEDSSAITAVLYGVGLVLTVPLVALVAGTGVLAPEIDDGSVVYLLAKPVRRPVVVVSKWVVAVGCVAVFGVLPVALTGLFMNPSAPELGVGYGLGALLGGVTYAAVFVLLAVLTRHAVVYGLVYVLLWEGLLGSVLSGIRWLSVTQWGTAVAAPVSEDLGLETDLGVPYALVAAAVVTVAAVWLAGQRLRSFTLSGEE